MNELLSLSKSRERRLMESRKLFRFLREAEEVAEWINDQTVVAASEDYGRDVEHVELLIQVGRCKKKKKINKNKKKHNSEIARSKAVLFFCFSLF